MQPTADPPTDDVESVRARIFLARLPQITPELERGLASQVMALKAKARASGIPARAAWEWLRGLTAPLVDPMLETDLERLTWESIDSRILAYLES